MTGFDIGTRVSILRDLQNSFCLAGYDLSLFIGVSLVDTAGSGIMFALLNHGKANLNQEVNGMKRLGILLIVALFSMALVCGCGEEKKPPAKAEAPPTKAEKAAPPAPPEHPKADPTKPEQPKPEHPKSEHPK